MDAAAELGRNPVSKHQIQPEYGVGRLTRDGMAEPVSRDQIPRHARGQAFPVQLTTSRIGSFTRLVHICDDDTYIHIYIYCYYVPGMFLLLLIHTFSVLSLQQKKLRRHNKSAIDLSNANPACGHKKVRRLTSHIMVITRYSDQQGSKSRLKAMRLYKQWHRPLPKRFIKPPFSISRATSIDSYCCRLSTTSVLSNKPDKLINKSKFLKTIHCTKRRKLKYRGPWWWRP